MAMVHVAIFEAINGIANVFEPYHVIDKPKFNASTVAAAATAAHKVLVALFPTQVEEFDAQLMTSLAGIPTNPLTSGREWGTVCANDVLTMRSNDNSALESTPQPTNQLPGFWIPTEPVFRPPLLPNWPLVKPFTLSSGSSLRPEVLPALTSEEYTIAFNEVKNLGRKTSTLRTEEQSQIALFWADSAGTETPPGHWLRIAMEVAMARGLSTLERARLCALLGMGLADAAIVAWDAKYAFNHWRPITGIRAASTDGNPGTDEDVSWSPLIPTPPFPAFTSGHSTFSATAARIIARVLGSDNIAFETTSQGLPNITRSFASFSAAAAEAGQSRIYGGIHWQYDNQNALAKGIQLGDHIIDRFLKPIGELNTTTSIPTTTKPTTRNPTSKPTTRVPTAKPTTRKPI
jgi:membrane-associated phospholipid phosphatase